MSTTINSTNIVAAKAYGGVDLVAIYGQGNVKVWEAGPTDYSKKYLTFVAKDSGTFQFEKQNSNTVSYSTDNGATWSTPAGDVTINVVAGDKVLWKGELISSYQGSGAFSASTASFDIKGNIMSLLYGDSFIGKTAFRANSSLINLFKDTHCCDAGDLKLPATSL